MNIYMFVNVDWFFLSHRLEIAEESVKRNVQMTVYTDFTENHSENAFGNFLILNSPIRRKSNNIISLSLEFFKAYILIKNDKPDIVHAVTIKPIILLGIICFFLKIPFIASISGLGPGFSEGGNLKKIRRRLVMFVYKAIFSAEKARAICQSKHDAETLISNGILSENKIVFTEGSGVRISNYDNTQSIKSEEFNILMASRLIPEKGIMEFCAAAGAISSMNNFKTKFSLAGILDLESPDAFTEDQVIEMCESNDVQYLGHRRDIPSILSETHIFVLPSYFPCKYGRFD